MGFRPFVLYLRHVPGNGILPAKTQREKWLDRTYWAHNSHEPLDRRILLLTRISEVLLGVVGMNFELSFAKEKRIISDL